MENNRGSFGSNFGFIMAAVGSAVGLGNIWGFPYKMGSTGGFAFLLVYVLLAIFVGLAVMVGELALGRKTGQSPVGAYKAMADKYAWLGYCGVICGFWILCFYFVLGGMVLRYMCGYFMSIFGVNTWGFEGADIANFFGTFICDGTTMMIYFAVYVVINVIVVAAGVGDGIEKFCKIGMPALFVMLLIVLVYVAVQPGAGEGYKFMFGLENAGMLKTDFVKVLKTAAGQMFFSLSLGMGCMITYGSYLSKKENIQKNAVIIVLCDTLIATMAGMVVMPACFAFGVDPGGGPGLLFQSMQVVFYNMGGFVGNLMGFLFYFLVFIASLSSSLSILEVCTAHRVDKNIAAGKAPGRKKACIVFSIVIFIVGSLVALDGLGTGLAGGATIPYPAELLGIEKHTWSGDWLDFFDMISEGVLMPFGAMVMSILIGWVWKINVVIDECEISGKKFWGHAFFWICYKVITPAGMAFVLLAQLDDFFNFGIF